MKKLLATVLTTVLLATSTVTVFASVPSNPVIADQFHEQMNIAAVTYVYGWTQCGYPYESPDEILQDFDLDYCYGNIEYMDAVTSWLTNEYGKAGVK